MVKKLSLKHFNFFILIYVCLHSASLAAEEVPPWFNELFGDGDFDVDAVQFIAKHLSRQDFSLNFMLQFHLRILWIKASKIGLRLGANVALIIAFSYSLC
jgi:hypothetical protein